MDAFGPRLVCALLLLPVCFWQEGSGQTTHDPIKLAKEAFANAQLLQSGIGAGTYEFYQKGPKDLSLTLIRKGQLKLRFSGNKYQLDFSFDKGEKNNWERQIIISDGSAIFSSTFF